MSFIASCAGVPHTHPDLGRFRLGRDSGSLYLIAFARQIAGGDLGEGPGVVDPKSFRSDRPPASARAGQLPRALLTTPGEGWRSHQGRGGHL